MIGKILLVVDSLLIIIIIASIIFFASGYKFILHQNGSRLTIINRNMLPLKKNKIDNRYYIQATGKIASVEDSSLKLRLVDGKEVQIFYDKNIIIQEYTIKNKTTIIQRINNFQVKDLTGKEVLVIGIEEKNNLLIRSFKAQKVIIYPADIKERVNFF